MGKNEKKERDRAVEENVRVVLDVFSAIERRDERRVRDLIQPDLVIHSTWRGAMKDEASSGALVVGAVNEQAQCERAHVSVADALRKLETVYGARSVALFEHGSLQVKMYAPRRCDPQTPHSRGELYVVARGDGVFFD